MSTYKVLFTDPPSPELTEERAALAAMGAEVVVASKPEPDCFIREAADADVVVNRFAPVTRAYIEATTHCKMIIRTGIGVDSIDVAAATEKGIMVSCVPDYCREEVADHTVALSLGIARRLRTYDTRVRQGQWVPVGVGYVPRLSETIYGIMGFGNIARMVAHRMQGFGCRIMAYDPYLPDSVFTDANVVRAQTPEEIFRAADFVSLNLPLTEETRHMVNKDTLAMMKPTAFIINTGRGPLICQADLLEALEKHVIAGAGLDVLENEPLPAGDPLGKMDNVLLSPHAAFYSQESLPDLNRKTLQEVIRALKGEPLHTWINRPRSEK